MMFTLCYPAHAHALIGGSPSIRSSSPPSTLSPSPTSSLPSITSSTPKKLVDRIQKEITLPRSFLEWILDLFYRLGWRNESSVMTRVRAVIKRDYHSSLVPHPNALFPSYSKSEYEERRELQKELRQPRLPLLARPKTSIVVENVRGNFEAAPSTVALQGATGNTEQPLPTLLTRSCRHFTPPYAALQNKVTVLRHPLFPGGFLVISEIPTAGETASPRLVRITEVSPNASAQDSHVVHIGILA